MLTISHYVFIHSLAGEYFPHLAFLVSDVSHLAQAGFQNHSRQVGSSRFTNEKNQFIYYDTVYVLLIYNAQI